MSIYKNLYYRFYRFSILISESKFPRQRAVVIFSILQILNFVEIATIFSIITHQIWVINWPKWVLFLLGIGIIWTNMRYIINMRNYTVIEKRFINESTTSNRLGILLAFLYVVMTIVIFAGTLFYLNKRPIR